PSGGGLRHIAAMVDPQRSELTRKSSVDTYRDEIAKTEVFKTITADASMIEGPRGFDASPYRASQYAGDKWLLVGDAGSFVDPLSSAGVKKALASAWLAAVAVNTALKTPSMRGAAFEFFSTREEEIERQLSRQSSLFLAGAAAAHDRPFWDERSDERGPDDDDNELVRQALHRLRATTLWQPRIGPSIRIQPRPMVRGNEIVLEPHLISANHPRGTRYVRGVDIVTLVQLAPSILQVPDLFESYTRKAGDVPLPDFLYAVATAVAHGWLVAE
ncbi:MAG TPA: hypothetical protein VFZ31_13805, partial [Vicinamibacterales bacterium]